MARLVFSRDDETMYLLDRDGYEVDSWDAANNATNSTGRPCEEGSHGPAPNGNWDIDWGVQTRSGDAYGGDNEEFIPIGDYGSDGCHPSDEAAERGIGIHGGRDSYESPTWGCIRMNDGDIAGLADYFDTQEANGDAIDSITIMDDNFDAGTFDPNDVDNECEDEDPPGGEGSSYDPDGGGGPGDGGGGDVHADDIPGNNTGGNQ